MNTTTEIFSKRSKYYAEFRPSYSESLLGLIVERCGLTAEHVVADLGSGTGTLTSLFLRIGNSVFAVEPNADMRAMSEQLLGRYPGFKSVNATAEATTLPGRSVDLVTAGRAMQWFDIPSALQEISRILRPGGWTVAVWNELRPSPLVSAYRDVVSAYCSNSEEMAQRRQGVRDLLERLGFGIERLENKQRLNLAQLKGLILSLSSSPGPESPRFEAMMRDVEDVFVKYATNDYVQFDYMTLVYFRRAPFST